MSNTNNAMKSKARVIKVLTYAIINKFDFRFSLE